MKEVAKVLVTIALGVPFVFIWAQVRPYPLDPPSAILAGILGLAVTVAAYRTADWLVERASGRKGAA